MIVRDAVESKCAVLWTEDLADGQLGRVRIRNPFAVR
jgi:predicted nucleic acid-binding protein